MNKRKNKKQLTIITLIFSIISLVFVSTIAYSAFSSTMNITGIAHARVEADVRITDFVLDETVNATSSYEEFGKDTVSTSLSLKDNAYAIYKVEVTNYGEPNVGIYSITGIPEGISYEIIDYTLKDKICNNSGKCNKLAAKTFYIKFTGSNIETEFTLTFKFKIFHNFAYVDFNNTYVSGVLDGESITIDLSKDSPKMVSVSSDNFIDYTYTNNILTLKNVTCDLKISAVTNTEYLFDYTGNSQTFTVPYDGSYKVELWGAQGGGGDDNDGGRGGYTSGIINLKQNDKLYVYVGSEGGLSLLKDTTLINCKFNGGGSSSGQIYEEDRYWGTGGGATDIRLVSGSWDDFNSLKSRIMVAAAGGGRYVNYSSGRFLAGGSGGGLIGFSGQNWGSFSYGSEGTGGTQTLGGYNFVDAEVSEYNWATGNYGYGGFGYGGNSNAKASYSGGGSGYYGGGSSTHSQSAGGGSSFISGHNGCDAIDVSSTKSKIVHTGQSLHYSGYKFKTTVMIDGSGYNWTTEKGTEIVGMPTYDGTSTMIGNEGNGYAKITLLNTQIIYNINYSNIPGNYQSNVKKGADLVIDFKEDAPHSIIVLIDGVKSSNYTYTNGILTIKNVSNDIEVKGTYSYEFGYTGSSQIFTVPYNGVYKVELWGASGGSGLLVGYDSGITNPTPGKGAYTSGTIELQKNNNLYLYIGGKGQNATDVTKISPGGYNGGGDGVPQILDYSNDTGGGGGGATDIRLTNGECNNFDSLKSRIMVAAGGGGTNFIYTDSVTLYTDGMYAGGLSVTGDISTWINYWTPIVNQTSGGAFGYGLNGVLNTAHGGGGGGSGYYGGYSKVINDLSGPGSGGTSFISGHNGCDAITSDSTSSNITHTGQSIHYSGYKFTNTIMIDGLGYNWTTVKGTEVIGMPTHDGTSTMTGNEGNGYAKISLIKLQ